MKLKQLKIVRGWIGVVLAAVACSYALLAQSTESQQDIFLKRLDGIWQGEGKTLGMPARLRLNWGWVWKNRFLRLSLKNEITAPNGQTQVFEGIAYYRPVGEGKYEASWFDSRGWTFPIKATYEGDALTAFWGSPDTEQGKSIYRFLAPKKLEVIDEVRQKNGVWKEFGRFVVQRE